MGTVTSISDHQAVKAEEALAPDQHMGLLAHGFEMELAEATDDHVQPWSMARTIWVSVAVSLVLWGIIIAAIRLL